MAQNDGTAMPDDAQYLWFTVDTFEESVGAAAIGVLFLPLAVLAQRPLARAQAHLARWLLAPSLAARVERLTETRAGAVDAATSELQRAAHAMAEALYHAPASAAAGSEKDRPTDVKEGEVVDAEYAETR